MGISLFAFFVFGEVIITFDIFLSLSFIYMRCTVFEIINLLFLKSISFHCNAHNSPILIPEYKDNNIPIFLEVKLFNT